jgi:hypothetical protein
MKYDALLGEKNIYHKNGHGMTNFKTIQVNLRIQEVTISEWAVYTVCEL